jgi:hypothetical protein
VQREAKNRRRQGAMEGYYRVSRSQQPLSSWGMQNALGSQAKARLSGHHIGRFLHIIVQKLWSLFPPKNRYMIKYNNETYF